LKICVIIPVHNEGETIGRLVAAARKKGIDVVVIDDGSTDGSGAKAEQEGGMVLANRVRQGKGLSLQKGFDYAVRHGYDGVITIDGDGQHDVGDIDSFLAMIAKEPVSVITGTRMANPKGMPWTRLLTNRVMSFLISIVCGQRIPDTQCGYRYIHSDVLKSIHLNSRDFEIETEVLVEACKKGYSIISVPIKTIYRGETSDINPITDTVRFVRYLMRELFKR